MKTLPKEAKLLYIAGALAAAAGLLSENPLFFLATAVFTFTGYTFSK